MIGKNALEALKSLGSKLYVMNHAKWLGTDEEELDTIRLALTELEEIKKRAEEMKQSCQNCIEGNINNLENMDKIAIIDYILKGETK